VAANSGSAKRRPGVASVESCEVMRRPRPEEPRNLARGGLRPHYPHLLRA
jgi:hypothetical protein